MLYSLNKRSAFSWLPTILKSKKYVNLAGIERKNAKNLKLSFIVGQEHRRITKLLGSPRINKESVLNFPNLRASLKIEIKMSLVEWNGSAGWKVLVKVKC